MPGCLEAAQTLPHILPHRHYRYANDLRLPFPRNQCVWLVGNPSIIGFPACTS